MQVQPYLFFDGCCEEAAQFYRRAIGDSRGAVRARALSLCPA
jgi:uncharacterized glyoxalase superfamily protein PhnB